jgi:hypothetical protein
MTDEETQRSEETGRAPSEPERDPKEHPAPPSNPEADKEDVERGEEQLRKISGH